MVGAPGSLAPPPRGVPSTFFSVDYGHSQISIIASQEAHHRHFLALMVGALGSPAMPPGGPPLTFSTSLVTVASPTGSTLRGAYHPCFQLQCWPLPVIPAAPQRVYHRLLRLNGSRCQTSGNASQGGHYGAYYKQDIFSANFFWVFALLRTWRDQLQQATKTV
jgi:hypothetical protein